ncbi:MAG: hypothetical protein JO301_06060 [Chitinophagaceae bacterium]|nr:hypothetical protein [Chitinophagaceae bacterium]
MWVKKGLLLEPQTQLWWQKSHIMLPAAAHIEGDLFRVYFSGRDEHNRSVIGYAEVKVYQGTIELQRYCDQPVLTSGELGTFDDNGVTPSCVVTINGRKHLYYIGWNSGSTTRMGLIAGLAISDDDGNFHRYSRAPLLDRTDREPFSILTAPFVIEDNGSFRMYYVSCEGWLHRDLPIYNIKYAESTDGINWKREGHVCIDFRSPQETALARPCVVKDADKYRMWYSYKDPAIGYRIGYAESDDAKNWIRMDHNAGIDVSPRGWDSEMVEYSFVFDHEGYRYMLYNGNGYGTNGAGYAVFENNRR